MPNPRRLSSGRHRLGDANRNLHPIVATHVSVLATSTIFVAVFVFILRTEVAPQFQYLGFFDRDFNTLEFVSAVLVTALGTFTLRHEWQKPSDVGLSIIFFLVLVPVVWVPLYQGNLETRLLLELQWLAVAGALILRLCCIGRVKQYPLDLGRLKLVWFLMASAVIVAMVGMMMLYGLRPTAVDLLDVYDTREEFTDAIGGPGRYLTGALANAVLPMALAIGLHLKRWSYVAFSIAAFFYLFTLTGYKSFYLSVLVTLLVYVLLRFKKSATWLFPAAVSASMLLALASDKIASDVVAVSVVVRRGLATGGLNTSHYIDYFNRNEKYGLRHSVLAGLGEPPSSEAPREVIGYLYYSSPVAANVSYIGDGYANFGNLGILLGAIILGLFLRVLNSVASGLPIELSGAAVVPILVSFSNSAPITTIGTHGGLVLLAVFAVVRLAAGSTRSSSVVSGPNR